MTAVEPPPRPGSVEARAFGCDCTGFRLDGDRFLIAADCPLHDVLPRLAEAGVLAKVEQMQADDAAGVERESISFEEMSELLDRGAS